jgi:DNA helicase HerA-like ATPase
LNISNLVLPYWLLNSEELEELFIDTEANDHNQRNVFQEAITRNKKKNFIGTDIEKERIHFDSPVIFDFREVILYIKNRNKEKQSSGIIKWKKSDDSTFDFNEDTSNYLFEEELESCGSSATGTSNGKFLNFINRLENKLNDKRLRFFLGESSKTILFEDSIKQLIGYKDNNKSNVTVIDLSGVPFEVLSITVSLISRILFDYGYFYKKYLNDGIDLETPLLLVYEEAHKYVPKNDSAKFRASRNAIERIAKEGRKYGVTLGIVSQRPSEISETIFSQCNNFIAMRLTNPTDQNYVKRLLPDTLGNLIDNLPSLQSGEGLLLGESIIMPSLVKIEKCDEDRQPSSNDVKYLEKWKEEWKEVQFEEIIKKWKE